MAAQRFLLHQGRTYVDVFYRTVHADRWTLPLLHQNVVYWTADSSGALCHEACLPCLLQEDVPQQHRLHQPACPHRGLIITNYVSLFFYCCFFLSWFVVCCGTGQTMPSVEGACVLRITFSLFLCDGAVRDQPPMLWSPLGRFWFSSSCYRRQCQNISCSLFIQRNSLFYNKTLTVWTTWVCMYTW